MKPKRRPVTKVDLRAQAEKIVSTRKAGTTRKAAPGRMPAEELLHELQVHEVELDLQIEELRRAEMELELLRDRYLALYEEAPVGYLTLDKYNLITQANISAATILKQPKETLVGRRFSSFFEKAFLAMLYEMITEARKTGERIAFDAPVVRADSSKAWVTLDILVARDTGELRIALVDVTDRRNVENELREVADHLITVQERERASIATALHDEAGQQLTYLCILLDHARDSGTPLSATELDEMSRIARGVLREVRALSSSLSPAELSRIGLSTAVESMIAEFSERTRVPVAFAPVGALDDFPPESSLAIYRIVQEALTNAARHANPRSVSISLAADADSMRIEITDDGVGFNSTKRPSSVGMLSMHERARAIGGKLTVQSSPGKGTTVTLVAPVGGRGGESYGSGSASSG
jgi:PAS domain S-box-containing protein